MSRGQSVILAAAVVLLALHLVVILRAAFEGGWFSTVWSYLRRCCTSAWRVPETDMDKAVHKQMQQRRHSNMNILTKLLVYVFPLFWVTIAWGFAATKELVALRVVAVFLSGASVTLLLCVCPQLLSPKTVRLWQCAYFAMACTLIAPGICPHNRLTNVSRLAGILLTATNCALLHVPTAVAQHGVYVMVVGRALAQSPLHANELPQLVSAEVMAAAFACTWIAVMQRLFVAQLRSTLQATCLAEKQLANNKLLSVFYEVVVEVDAELAIVSSDPDLGLFLPHGAGSPIPTLLGTKLDELLPDEQDRQLLLQRTNWPGTREESSVSVMHLTMGYRGNDSLNVELFSLRFCGLLGSQRHLLGIREFGDDELRRDGVGLTLRLDVSDVDCTIVDISPSLQRELGNAAPGTSFCEFVENVDEFRARLQFGFNTLVADDGLEPVYSFKTILRPRGQRMRVLADCCLSMDAHGVTPFDTYMTRLSFANLTPLRRSSVHSSSSSSSSRVPGTPRDRQSQRLRPAPSPIGVSLSL